MVIEEQIISFLNNSEAVDYPAYGDTPYRNKLPAHHYFVQKTGSREYDHIATAQVAIQSVTIASKATAATMNEALIEAMRGLSELTNIYSVKLNSDYDYTDTTTKHFRYQAVFDITYNREV